MSTSTMPSASQVGERAREILAAIQAAPEFAAFELTGSGTAAELPLPVPVDEQDEYRAVAEHAARGVPTPKPVAVVYTVALLALLALVTALIAYGRG